MASIKVCLHCLLRMNLTPLAVVSQPSPSCFLKRFQYLIDNLPETIPDLNALNDDRLAILTSAFNDVTVGSEDLWKTSKISRSREWKEARKKLFRMEERIGSCR